MKIPAAILLVFLGVILLIGGLFAFDPAALTPSRALTRLPPALAPWLFASGGIAALAGLFGLLGLFRSRYSQHAH